jgi:hypothetical protein
MKSLFIECDTSNLKEGTNRLIMEKYRNNICFEPELTDQLKMLVKHGYVPKNIWEIIEDETTLFDISLKNPKNIFDDIDLCFLLVSTDFKIMSSLHDNDKNENLEIIVDRLIPELKKTELPEFCKQLPKFLQTKDRFKKLISIDPKLLLTLKRFNQLTNKLLQELYDYGLKQVTKFRMNYKVGDLIQYRIDNRKYNQKSHFRTSKIIQINEDGTYDISVLLEFEILRTYKRENVPAFLIYPHILKEEMEVQYYSPKTKKIYKGVIQKINLETDEDTANNKCDIIRSSSREIDQDIPFHLICYTNNLNQHNFPLIGELINENNLKLHLRLFSPFEIFQTNKKMLKFMTDNEITSFCLDPSNNLRLIFWNCREIPIEYFNRNPKIIEHILSKDDYPGQFLCNINEAGIKITDEIIVNVINRTNDKQILNYYEPIGGYSIEVLMAYHKKHGYDYELLSYRNNGYHSKVKNEYRRIEKEKRDKEWAIQKEAYRRKMAEKKEKMNKFFENIKQKFQRAFSSSKEKEGYKIVPTDYKKNE